MKKNPDYGVDVGKSSVVADKSDISYWYGLLERGAITQGEYDAKKVNFYKKL